MKYNIGSGMGSSPEATVNEVTKSFQSPKLIMYFSPVDHFKEYTELIYAKFPNAICMGSTTLVGWSKGKADFKGLLAVGIESGIKCTGGVIHDVDKYPIKHVDVVKKCVHDLGTTRNTVCIEMTTALLCAEESVLATLNSVLLDKNIPVFGGSAGDTGTATGTMVAMNGKIEEKSTVFALIHNEGGAVHLFRENIYTPVTGNVLLATKVDVKTRKVMEYDHKPALRVFAQELGVSESTASKYFDTNPMGRIVGNETFITANCNSNPDNSVNYHARIHENSQVMVLGPANYRDINRDTMNQIKQTCPRPSFAIVCNCLARSLLFQGDGYVNEFASLLGNTVGEYVGFSGYGEQLRQHHFNQTLAVCVFE